MDVNSDLHVFLNLSRLRDLPHRKHKFYSSLAMICGNADLWNMLDYMKEKCFLSTSFFSPAVMGGLCEPRIQKVLINIYLFRSVKQFSLTNLFTITLFVLKNELQNRGFPSIGRIFFFFFFFLANDLAFILEEDFNLWRVQDRTMWVT